MDHITRVQEARYLVKAEFDCSAIITFVSVFINVFHCFDAPTEFDIDMAPKPLGQVRVIGDYISGIHAMRTFDCRGRLLSAPLDRIAVFL